MRKTNNPAVCARRARDFHQFLSSVFRYFAPFFFIASVTEPGKSKKFRIFFSRQFDSGFSSFSCEHESFRSHGLAKYSLFIRERIESPISIYSASGFATDLAIRSQEYPFHVSLSFFPFLFPSRC